ncbi:MAG: guanylate kinase [Victivallales bacterium]|nr:guanylate kinase [Victivallales bacterium]
MTSDLPKRLGILIVVSGASGTGKSTICTQVRKDMPTLGFSVSCTTRPPRQGEKDAVDYYYISKKEFEKRIEAGAFIEYAEVFSNYYGTLKSEVMDRIKAGKDIFLDIDIQGAMQIQQAAENDALLKKCCEFIFIMPPSMNELEERLRGRSTDSEEQIKQRLKKAEKEISFRHKYEHLIVNDKLERAVSEMENLIRDMRLNAKRMTENMCNV